MRNSNILVDVELVVGDFRLGASYASEPDKIGIYRSSGEGGDFDRAEFEAHIAKFYEDRF